jgi:methionine-rich copper-binding protein CopC
VLLSMLTSLATAHTTIKSTVPANEAVLRQSPAVIEVAFEHIAQLTSVTVVVAGQEPRKLGSRRSVMRSILRWRTRNSRPDATRCTGKACRATAT